MKYFLIFLVLTLSSCTAVAPGLYKSDSAINLSIDRDSLQKESDVVINIKVKNNHPLAEKTVEVIKRNPV